MFKLLTYAGYDSHSGPHIFPIEADVGRSIGHIKMARELPPQIEDYIRGAKPVPGKTQLLIDAMGSSDYFGSNSNGDYFPTEALNHRGPEYGYETFMHYAFPFRNHVNKDPAKAYGDKVTLSAYDDKMHRVVLIVALDDSKCRDIIERIHGGDYPAVSMGCRVPQDFCSICGNGARNRGEYCDHLRFQMNKILPDGRRVCAINRRPKFFDISVVPIGAEKASFVLKKVAHAVPAYEINSRPSAELGELYYAKLAEAERKVAGEKSADITKQVPAQDVKIEGVTSDDRAKMDTFMADAEKVKAEEAPLPTPVLDAMAQWPLKDVFATLAAVGIDLRPEEFQRIILVKLGAAKLAAKLASARLVFDAQRPAKTAPRWADEFTQLSIRDVNEKVAMLLRPYLAERSCYPEILAARLERMEKAAADEIAYNRGGQWFPMTDEQRRLSSGVPGAIPASLALAAGFMVFKRAFPQVIASSPTPIKAVAAHPWLLPLLMAAGVGASVGVSTMTEPRALTSFGTGAGLDGKKPSVYHQPKTAGVDPVRFGPVALAYMQSGAQRSMTGSVLTKHAAFSSRTDVDVSIFESVHRLARKKETHAHSR